MSDPPISMSYTQAGEGVAAVALTFVSDGSAQVRETLLRETKTAVPGLSEHAFWREIVLFLIASAILSIRARWPADDAVRRDRIIRSVVGAFDAALRQTPGRAMLDGVHTATRFLDPTTAKAIGKDIALHTESGKRLLETRVAAWAATEQHIPLAARQRLKPLWDALGAYHDNAFLDLTIHMQFMEIELAIAGQVDSVANSAQAGLLTDERPSTSAGCLPLLVLPVSIAACFATFLTS